MKNKKNENTFLIIWCTCVVILLVICFCGINITLKGTSAYFGGGTTGSFTRYSVHYYSNYPEGTIADVEPISDMQNSNFNKLLDNMFEVPEGYQFVGWRDDSGVDYLPEEVKFLSSDLNMYARWELIVSDDTTDDSSGDNGDGNDDNVSAVSYGDVNLNGEIDSDDYLLVENHVAGTSILTGDALVNADVNIDGKIDLVDADIIKNAYLGTRNYVGYLPSNPILIYDIYEGNIDVGTGDTIGGSDEGTTDDSDNTSNNGSSVSGGGTGSGSTGSGSGSSSGGSSNGGGTSGGSASSSGSSSNKGQNNNTTSGDSTDNSDNNNDEENDVTPEPIIYEFKYMNGNLEFANTKCEVSNNNCELVLPSNNPARSGYTFKGWSLNKDCSGDNIVNASIMVESSNTYYACYLKNVDSETSGNKYYVWIIVFAISALSLRLIWHLIYKFRNEENNTD